MRRCGFCGNANAGDASYCDGCGKALEPETRSAGDPGPLLPEPPIGGPAAGGGPAVPAPGPTRVPRSGRSVEFRGTVRRVVEPNAQFNPWLVVDVTTDNGETIAVRAWFSPFALITVSAPYISPGHRIRVNGRWTRRGYFKPRSIVNESTQSKWRR
jgi:hypothetical protein